MVDADGLEVLALLRAAGGAEDFRAGAKRELHGGQPDAARGRVDQHAIPLTDPRQLVQSVVSGHERDGDAGRFGEAHPRRHSVDRVGRGGQVGSERALAHGHHSVADCDVGHAGADRRHHAGALAADRPRVARIHAQHVEHVAEVQAAGADFDLDLARSGRPSLQGPHDDVVQHAPLTHRDHVRLARRQLQAGRRPRVPGEPRSIPLSAPQRDLVLSIVRPQLGEDRIDRVLGRRGPAARLQVDQHGTGFRVLELYRPDEAPERRLRDRKRAFLAGDRLRAARDVQDGRALHASGGRGLHQRERAAADTFVLRLQRGGGGCGRGVQADEVDGAAERQAAAQAARRTERRGNAVPADPAACVRTDHDDDVPLSLQPVC